jgi:hypothetical protein
MAGLIGQLMTLLCGSFLTIILFSLTSLIQHFPNILKQLLVMIIGFLNLSYIFYKFVLKSIIKFLQIETPKIVGRTMLTLVFSMSLTSVLFLIYMPNNPLIPMSIAIAHGLYIGIAWDRLADPDGIRLGVHIE